MHKVEARLSSSLTVFISVAQSVSSPFGQLVGHTHNPCSQWAPCLQLTPRHKSKCKIMKLGTSTVGSETYHNRLCWQQRCIVAFCKQQFSCGTLRDRFVHLCHRLFCPQPRLSRHLDLPQCSRWDRHKCQLGQSPDSYKRSSTRNLYWHIHLKLTIGNKKWANTDSSSLKASGSTIYVCTERMESNAVPTISFALAIDVLKCIFCLVALLDFLRFFLWLTARSVFHNGNVGLLETAFPFELTLVIIGDPITATHRLIFFATFRALTKGQISTFHTNGMVVTRPFTARPIRIWKKVVQSQTEIRRTHVVRVVTTNAKVFGRQIKSILATVFLHFAQIVVWFSIVGTHGSHYGLAALIAHTIGNALFVDLAFLTKITAEQLALIQACKQTLWHYADHKSNTKSCEIRTTCTFVRRAVHSRIINELPTLGKMFLHEKFNVRPLLAADDYACLLNVGRFSIQLYISQGWSTTFQVHSPLFNSWLKVSKLQKWTWMVSNQLSRPHKHKPPQKQQLEWKRSHETRLPQFSAEYNTLVAANVSTSPWVMKKTCYLNYKGRNRWREDQRSCDKPPASSGIRCDTAKRQRMLATNSVLYSIAFLPFCRCLHKQEPFR